MSIGSLNDYIGSTKQLLTMSRLATRTSVANVWFAVRDLAGNPGAGTLAGSNTAAGVVPTDATAGAPIINFSSGAGYVATVDFACSVACRLALYDCLFHAGAYAFNAAVTLASQPSYSGRVPGGTDYTGLQLWMETVTGFTGSQSIAVTYTNENGTTGHTTGTIATGVAPTIGRLLQLPLASGDAGIQKVESVTSTVSSVGTFNIMVLRPLWSGRVPVANFGDCHGIDRTGLPQIFGDSCLMKMVCADSTSTGLSDLLVEIASA